MRQLLFLVSLIAATSVGCDESDMEPLPDGRHYFPLEIGTTLTYRSDSVIFDDLAGGNVLDTLSGFVRESIVDTATTSAGVLTYIINRSYRKTESDPWGAPVPAVLRTSDQFAYRIDGNFQFVKMRFPLRDYSSWEPTALFNDEVEVQVGTEMIQMYSNWSGEVVSLHQAESIGAFTFDSVMTCVQADDDNEIERRFVTEKYALGVGLVFRADTILDSRCKRLGDLVPCFDETWDEKGEKGYILRQEVISID